MLFKNFRLVALLFVLSFAFAVYAEDTTVTFPIAELGGCQTKLECRVYCDDIKNALACTTFAEAHNLVSKEDAKKSKEFTNAILKKTGPGKCDSPLSCQRYCALLSHREECTTFAEAHGLIEKKELNRTKIITDSIQKGITPGSCSNKKDCEAYCDVDEHLEECVSFSLQLEDEDQIDDISELDTLPFCTNRESCQNLCSQEKYREECFLFAQKRGLVGGAEVRRIENNDPTSRMAEPAILRMKIPEVEIPKTLRFCVEDTLRKSGVTDLKSFMATSTTLENKKIVESIMKSCLEKIEIQKTQVEKGPIYLNTVPQTSAPKPPPTDENYRKCLLEKASQAGFDDKVVMPSQERFVLIQRFLEECRAEIGQVQNPPQNSPTAIPRPRIDPMLQEDISLPQLDDPEDATIFEE